jgi:hypothetical protein
VPPTELQAAIASSFETQCQERGNARGAEKVNQVLLERAIEASVGRPAYSDAERHRVYREDEMEVDAHNRRWEMLASRRPSPIPVALLRQEMVLSRVQRRQETVDCIARHGRVDMWNVAMDSKAGPSNAPPVPCGDDGHLF